MHDIYKLYPLLMTRRRVYFTQVYIYIAIFFLLIQVKQT